MSSEQIQWPYGERDAAEVSAAIFSKYRKLRSSSRDPEGLDEQFQLLWRTNNTTYEALHPQVGRMLGYFEHPEVYFDAMRPYVASQFTNAGVELSEEELTDFSLYSCLRPYTNYRTHRRHQYLLLQLDVDWLRSGTCSREELERGAKEVLKGGIPELAFCEPPQTLPAFMAPQWNRGNSDYPKYKHKSPHTVIYERLRRKKPIRVLDVGRGDSYFLDELKKTFGDAVYAAGINAYNWRVQGRLMDEDHVGFAEAMPEAWRNAYDVVYSNYAFTYFLDPRRALVQIMKVMAPGGEAHLETYCRNNNAVGYDFLEELGYPRQYIFDRSEANFEPFLTSTGIKKLVKQTSNVMGVRFRCECDQNASGNTVHLFKQS